MKSPIFLIAVLVIGMMTMGLLYRSEDAVQEVQAAELNTRQIALEAEVSRQMDNAAILQARIAELESGIAASNQVKDETQTRQAQLEADNALLVQRIIELQVERDHLASQMQTLAQENQRLNQQVATQRPDVTMSQPETGSKQKTPAARETPWWLLLGITGLPVVLIGALFIYFARTWSH